MRRFTDAIPIICFISCCIHSQSHKWILLKEKKTKLANSESIRDRVSSIGKFRKRQQPNTKSLHKRQSGRPLKSKTCETGDWDGMNRLQTCKRLTPHLFLLSIFDGPFPSTIFICFTRGGLFSTGVLFRWRWCVKNVLRHQFQVVLDVLEFREKSHRFTITTPHIRLPNKATKKLIWKRNKSWFYIKFNWQINKQHCYCRVSHSIRLPKELTDITCSQRVISTEIKPVCTAFDFECSVH